MSTQWRVGPVGATGLDYNALPLVMRMQNVPRAAQAEVFEGLRVLEEAAMDAMRANNKP